MRLLFIKIELLKNKDLYAKIKVLQKRPKVERILADIIKEEKKTLSNLLTHITF